jgi:beta-lactamase superfamily II metal-dependent hydrolase
MTVGKMRGFFTGLAGALTLLTLASTASAQANGQLQIHVINVGQGDATLIISPQGQTMLIDTGPLSASSCASATGIITYLTNIGFSRLDYHVASHYDADHIGCTDHIVARWPIQIAAYDRGAGSPPSTQTYTRYATAVASKRQTVSLGQVITLDPGTAAPVTFQVVGVSANGQTVSDENDRGVVLVMRFGTFDASFGGDLPGFVASGHKDIETSVAGGIGRVEYYKVHHHGSATSSNSTLMATLRPRVATMSMSATNGFGHPTSGARSDSCRRHGHVLDDRRCRRASQSVV